MTGSPRRLRSPGSGLRGLFAALAVSAWQAAFGQVPTPTASALHITVTLVDESQKPMPVPRHALLISDNPATAPPKRVVTGLDGSVNVKLHPGNYTVESDRPVVVGGKSYQWTQVLDIVAGRDARLDLTAANAIVEAAPGEAAGIAGASPRENDPAFLLPQSQDSVVAVWTTTTRGSGVVVDARGLVVTNQRGLRDETAVEVQFTPALKVAARVLASDRARDVAVLWIDAAAGSARPVPLDCDHAAEHPLVADQEIFAVGWPLRGPKAMTEGRVDEVSTQATVSDLRLAPGSLGGPVFAAGARLAGITSVFDESDEQRAGDGRIVPVADLCAVVASAERKMAGAVTPGGAHLPVEPTPPFAVEALKEVARLRVGNLNPYQVSSDDYDIYFITPVMLYAAMSEQRQADRRERDRDAAIGMEQARLRPLSGFANWASYVSDVPPVLLVRVTPKFTEGFWTKVGRGAASTQGIAIPPIKRFRPGFARMRAFCGNAEITPIHPFRLEQQITDDLAIHEGLYVFDPGALGSHCGSAKLVLYSEKDPDKGDTRVVEPGVLQRIAQDFAQLGGK